MCASLASSYLRQNRSKFSPDFVLKRVEFMLKVMDFVLKRVDFVRAYSHWSKSSDSSASSSTASAPEVAVGLRESFDDSVAGARGELPSAQKVVEIQFFVSSARSEPLKVQSSKFNKQNDM